MFKEEATEFNRFVRLAQDRPAVVDAHPHAVSHDSGAGHTLYGFCKSMPSASRRYQSARRTHSQPHPRPGNQWSLRLQLFAALATPHSRLRKVRQT
jgi:hypothetical protein